MTPRRAPTWWRARPVLVDGGLAFPDADMLGVDIIVPNEYIGDIMTLKITLGLAALATLALLALLLTRYWSRRTALKMASTD